MQANLPWYNAPIFVAGAVVFLTLLTTRIASKFDMRERRKDRAAVMKIAFAAEVQALVQIMEPLLRDLIKALKTGTAFQHEIIPLPRAVYEANVARIGEIGDIDLVYFLTMTYSHLRCFSDRSEHQGGPEGAPTELQMNLPAMLIGWLFAVAADSILRQITRDTVKRPVDARVSEEDAKRLNITVDYFNHLLSGENTDGQDGH